MPTLNKKQFKTVNNVASSKYNRKNEMCSFQKRNVQKL